MHIASRPLPSKYKSNAWVRGLLSQEAEPMPERLADIVRNECSDCQIPVPKLIAKKVNAPWYLGGYTTHAADGEICIVFGDGSWEGTTNERQVILHEMAHWIVGPEYHHPDGHTPRFYAELTRLVLKHDIDLNHFLEDEVNYLGDAVFDGLEMYNSIYNLGE